MHRHANLSSRFFQSLSDGKRLRKFVTAAILLSTAAIGFSGAAAHAQDLSQYGASHISVFMGSTAGAGSNPSEGALPTSGPIPEFTSVLDAAGNIYFTDNANRVRIFYVAGQVPPLLQFAVQENVSINSGLPPGSTLPTTAVAGAVYTLVNVLGHNCAGDACGDGGQANAASLSFPWGLAFDSEGNLYITDTGTSNVRKVNVSDGTISTVVGDPLHANAGYNHDNVPALGAYLSAPQFLTIDTYDNLFIADTANNLVRRVDAKTGTITTVAGDKTQPGVACTDGVCGEGGPATSALLGSPSGVAVDTVGDIYITEQGTSVVRKVDHTTGIITTVAGQINTPCDTSDTTVPLCGGEGVAATSAALNNPQGVHLDTNGNLIIADFGDNSIRGVGTSDASGKLIYTLAGTLSQSVGTGPVSGTASGAMFSYPYDVSIDPAGDIFIDDSGNSVIWKVTAPVPLTPQTITFNQIPDATYGNPSFDLTRYASVDSGLPLTFTCTGPVNCTGDTLTITGTGTVKVTASQVGDSTHSPTMSQPITFQVTKAALTVKADNISFIYNSGPQLPPLTYTLAGLVNGDSQSVVTGKPVLTTTATAASIGGLYPITVTLGTLAAANYSFIPQNGTLTITGGKTQTITFNPLPNVTYGAATFNLTATASSGDPVTYTVTGPAQLLGAALTVTGAGTVVVTANQSGDTNYGAAPAVTQSFQVAPAILTITAQPATRPYNTPNPAFMYAASGFVSADTAAGLTGAPAFTTTATLTSVPGTYPITVSQGTLFSSNYTFTFVSSTLTITTATQTITFPAIASVPSGSTVVLGATSSSGLPVTYTVTGPAIIVDGNSVQGTAPGTATVTASQAGNSFYAAATPVSQTFVVPKSVVQLNATSFTIAFGAAIPTLTYQVLGGFVPLANEYSGQPNIGTAATAGSPPGQYPIIMNQGTLVSSFYDFTLVNGTLTILPPSSFILTASPPNVTIPVGQARQVTVTLTPVNNFVGSVTLGCSGLPAGVTCTASPNMLTTVLGASGISVQPVSATLTISAGAPIATAQNRSAPGHSGIFAASWFWFPSLLLGGLLAWQRKRLPLGTQASRLFLVGCLLLGASSLIACGSSSGGSNSVQPGTTTIQVTGAGTSTSGATSASLSLNVTIQ